MICNPMSRPLWQAAMTLLALFTLTACGPQGDDLATQTSSAGGLVVTDAYMPEPPPGRKMGAVYLRLHNRTEQDRNIMQVDTDLASVAEVHQSVYEGEVVRMREVPNALVPAGQSLVFEPGSYHIMLMGMEPLAEGQKQFELRLSFDDGATAVVGVQVTAP